MPDPSVPKSALPKSAIAPSTRLAQALVDEMPPDLAAQHLEIVPPIHISSTYLRDADNGYRSGLVYGRADNPTVQQVEGLLARLEGAADALLFGSGMAAATCVLQSLNAGDHVIAPKVMYWSLRNWLAGMAGDWGLASTFVDMADLAAVKAAVRPGQTRLIWLETPANPLWSLGDIRAIAQIAHANGARLAVDSTVATPILTQPLTLGADIVMHSASKYLNGHSDVIAGALATATADSQWQKMRRVRSHLGAILSPRDAAQLLRGMRTLHLRVRESCTSALLIAEHFAQHAAVHAVLYPGLKAHPQHALAARQMVGGFGGMLSLRIADGEAAAIAIAAKTRLWKRATSLGGVESLIEHRASVEGADTPVPLDLLRLSVGIEAVEDLIADLEQAMRG